MALWEVRGDIKMYNISEETVGDCLRTAAELVDNLESGGYTVTCGSPYSVFDNTTLDHVMEVSASK